VPDKQREWLITQLEGPEPVIVFIHQRFDGDWTSDNKMYMQVSNAFAVREILQKEPDKVIAVFQGHMHEGGYSQVNGIHYYTIKAMLRGTGSADASYAIAEVRQDNSVAVAEIRKMAHSNRLTCG